MDLADHIEDRIVAGSEGFFDIPLLRENLHVTIRITRDFYDFLVRFGEKPPAEEIDYVMGTISSGIESFFLLAYDCRSINKGSKAWNFDSLAHSGFSCIA